MSLYWCKCKIFYQPIFTFFYEDNKSGYYHSVWIWIPKDIEFDPETLTWKPASANLLETRYIFGAVAVSRTLVCWDCWIIYISALLLIIILLDPSLTFAYIKLESVIFSDNSGILWSWGIYRKIGIGEIATRKESYTLSCMATVKRRTAASKVVLFIRFV